MSLPILWSREYRLVTGQDWEDNQYPGPPTFDFPVTFFTYAASMADPNYAYYRADMDTTSVAIDRTTPWVRLPFLTPALASAGVATGDSFYKTLFRYYASDGVAPPMQVNSVIYPPVVPGSKMLGGSVIQFALVGEVDVEFLPFTLGDVSALTIPGSFSGERYIVGLNSTWYQTARTSRDDEARFVDVKQETDLPLWDAAGSSSLSLNARSYNDFWADFLNPGSPFPTLTDRYAGLSTTVTSARVAVGDVVDLGEFTNATLNGESWQVMVLTTGVSEYDPAPVTKSYERVRSNLQSDTGSLLDSVTVNPVDASFREATLLSTTRSPAGVNVFLEAMQPNVLSTGYVALPEQSTEYLNEYSGETLLARMARTYPPAVIGKAEEIFGGTLPTFTVNSVKYVTPQTLIQAFLGFWDTTYTWFSAKPVPDLRIAVPDPVTGTLAVASPSAYQSDFTLGRIGAPVVAYQQDKDSRLTMRQLLEELLSPFPGTVLRSTPGGQLEIVTQYGPDSDASPVVTLGEADVYEISRGQPNPLGIINKCTVTSTPYTVTVDAGAMVQAYFRLRSNAWVYSLPDDPADGSGTDLSAPTIAPGKPIFGWNPQAWEVQDNVLVDGEIKLKDSSNNVKVTIPYFAQLNSVTGTHTPAAADVNNIPIDGTTVTAIKTRIFVGNTFWPNAYLRIELKGRYNAASRSVSLWPDGVNDFEPTVDFQANPCSVVIQLDDATNIWERGSTTVTATYGQGLDEDILGDLGGALTASVDAYGERAVDINVTGYGITDPLVTQQIAQAYVLRAISPTLIRSVEQSTWRAFPVKFEHVGRLVQLPSAEQGRVITRSYTDDFGRDYSEGQLSSFLDVEVTDTTAAGYVDTTVEYLLLDDSSFLLLDDYQLAEVA